ncbi:hypothetical protein BGX29_002486 [Mortierella sp. GBA35]|nr:hypothetical protein BGX29_002486 [Mortierella sp. GBA35]
MRFSYAARCLEVTVSVVSPPFEKGHCARSIIVAPQPGGGNGTWTVNLTKKIDDLTVTIEWSRPNRIYEDYLKLQSMYIIPQSDFFNIVAVGALNWTNTDFCTARGQFSNEPSLKSKFPAKKVFCDGKYDFDIVLSTNPELTRAFAIIPPAPAPIPKPVPDPEPASSPASKLKGLGTMLLKDPTSVDVCFTFSSDKTYSDIGLWAHRCILSQHESFAKLIREAAMVHSLGNIVLAEKESNADTDSDTESISNISIDSMLTTATAATAEGVSVGVASKELVIKVDKVSLATFCVMIYYIYTGEINRSVDPIRFVLSNTDKATLVWRDSTGKIEDSVGWRPLDQGSSWRLKEVTWKELRDAAAHYGLEDLQAIADQEL